MYEDVIKSIVRKGNPSIEDTLSELGYSPQRFEREVLRPLNKTWSILYGDLLNLSMSEIGFISLRPVAEFYQNIITQANRALQKIKELADSGETKKAREYSESHGKIISMAVVVGAKLKDLVKFQMEMQNRTENQEDMIKKLLEVEEEKYEI